MNAIHYSAAGMRQTSESGEPLPKTIHSTVIAGVYERRYQFRVFSSTEKTSFFEKIIQTKNVFFRPEITSVKKVFKLPAFG
jgi:hypothetical protein